MHYSCHPFSQGSITMPRKSQDIPDAELAVLQQLWERGACTVRQLTEVLYPAGPGSQNATVQKLLDRLEVKQYVSRSRDQWPYLFQATVQRSDVIRKSLQATADKLCSGALAPLLTHLVRGDSLSVSDRASLRDLLQELDQKPGLVANM
jgi:BlaI family penicillinase repressor